MSLQTEKLQQLSNDIKQWAASLGFAQVGIADLDLKQYLKHYHQALSQGHYADMAFMQRNQNLREQPELLQEGALRVISVRMNYLSPQNNIIQAISNSQTAYISRYALGRDYHKLMRKKLKQLGELIAASIATNFSTSFRPFVDSAPILERPLAEKSGLGWIGKHSILINPDEGSLFFIGEILINLPLPTSKAIKQRCGKCSACIQMCPTQAIVGNKQVDARRCISYLTIENKAAIPLELRPLIGNRIYGCDDCQLVCPWNHQAKTTTEADFSPRNDLDRASLLELFSWSEEDFLHKTQGSAIRRIGFANWQRNIAVALGNAEHSDTIIEALEKTKAHNELVQEHIDWAIEQQKNKKTQKSRKQLRLERLIIKNPAL